jgi:hypothetical protein
VFNVGVIDTLKPLSTIVPDVVVKVVSKILLTTCAILDVAATPLAVKTEALAEIKVRVPPAF